MTRVLVALWLLALVAAIAVQLRRASQCSEPYAPEIEAFRDRMAPEVFDVYARYAGSVEGPPGLSVVDELRELREQGCL